MYGRRTDGVEGRREVRDKPQCGPPVDMKVATWQDNRTMNRRTPNITGAYQWPQAWRQTQSASTAAPPDAHPLCWARPLASCLRPLQNQICWRPTFQSNVFTPWSKLVVLLHCCGTAH